MMKLGGGFKYCLLSPRKFGGNDPIWLYNIFQKGWIHQIVKSVYLWLYDR